MLRWVASCVNGLHMGSFTPLPFSLYGSWLQRKIMMSGNKSFWQSRWHCGGVAQLAREGPESFCGVDWPQEPRICAEGFLNLERQGLFSLNVLTLFCTISQVLRTKNRTPCPEYIRGPIRSVPRDHPSVLQDRGSCMMGNQGNMPSKGNQVLVTYHLTYCMCLQQCVVKSFSGDTPLSWPVLLQADWSYSQPFLWFSIVRQRGSIKTRRPPFIALLQPILLHRVGMSSG